MFKIAAIIFMTGVVIGVSAEGHSDMTGFMLQVALGVTVMTIGALLGAPYIDEDSDT